MPCSYKGLLAASVGSLAAALFAPARPADAAAPAVALPDSVRAADASVQVAADADPGATVSFQVALRLRDRTDLDARIQGGERLSAAELDARHLPTPAAYRAVRDWLTGQGLTVTRDTDDRLMIEVRGTAAHVDRALGIVLSDVSVGGQDYIAATQAPSVPASVAAHVESINGLQPYGHMNPLGAEAGPARISGVAPAITISGDYYPGGILRAYKSLPYLTQGGSGTRTAILIDTLPNSSDLTQFWSLTGIAQSLSNIEFVNVPGGTLPASSIEDSLDAEWASSIGYQSKVRIYAAGSLAFTALDTAMHRILSDLAHGVAINQLSISLGACETTIARGQVDTDNSLFESIAAQGVTILVASGDYGAHECGSGAAGLHPSFYSTSPYVTAVGGTHLILTAASNNAPKVTIKTETGWSGSGGGISTIFAKPSYQSSLSYARRAVPDIAAVADPNTGVAYVLDGRASEIGGTSAATPIWAGFVAQVNQARIAAGLAELGALGPRIYPLVGTVNLRDTTQGNNGYPAGKGYDLVTGLGSPVMNKLLPTLVAQP